MAKPQRSCVEAIRGHSKTNKQTNKQQQQSFKLVELRCTIHSKATQNAASAHGHAQSNQVYTWVITHGLTTWSKQVLEMAPRLMLVTAIHTCASDQSINQSRCSRWRTILTHNYWRVWEYRQKSVRNHSPASAGNGSLTRVCATVLQWWGLEDAHVCMTTGILDLSLTVSNVTPPPPPPPSPPTKSW